MTHLSFVILDNLDMILVFGFWFVAFCFWFFVLGIRISDFGFFLVLGFWIIAFELFSFRVNFDIILDSIEN